MIIKTNMDQFKPICVLSKNYSPKHNKENLSMLKKFYLFYGIEMNEVDQTLIEDSFKGDTRFFFQSFNCDVENGDVSIIHDMFNRKILFFQNNTKQFEVSLSGISMIIDRTNISMGFIRLCNFYVPKRNVKVTYTTTDHFNPDFPISGNPLATLATITDPDKKDVSWMYAKTINTQIEDYIISPEMISYSKGEKTENIVDIYTKWIDGIYLKLELNDGYLVVEDKNDKKKIRLDR